MIFQNIFCSYIEEIIDKDFKQKKSKSRKKIRKKANNLKKGFKPPQDFLSLKMNRLNFCSIEFT